MMIPYLNLPYNHSAEAVVSVGIDSVWNRLEFARIS
jgi:hypothetical protein